MRFTSRRLHGERGVSLVEGAIIAPLFFFLIFGVMEFGLVFRQYLTVSTASQNGTRTASTQGNLADADYATLQQLQHSLTAVKSSEISYIVIFKATGTNSSMDSSPLSACKTASVANLCNRYTTTDFSRPASDFGNCPSVTTGPDHYWCPLGRNVSAAGPPDYLGVYIASTYKAITGVFGKNFTFGTQTIYRLEPQTR
jgi:Flp pilus assembly protein TadG